MPSVLRNNRLALWAFWGGLLVTGVVVLSPSVPLVVRSPGLQAVTETAGGIGTLAAALVVYGRFREHRSLSLALLYGALLTFGLTNLVLGAGPAAITTTNDSFDTWGALIVRVISALVFAAAAVVRSDRPIPAWVPTAAATATILATLAFCAATGDRLPPAVVLEGSITQVTGLTSHPVVAVANVTGLGAFIVAAWGFATRGEDPLYRTLAAAAVLGGFARLHLALLPSLYTGAVHSGDVFRLAFHAAVLCAALGELGRYWRDRQALAVADERRRVARDLHDGMAQELAFIASTTTRMAGTWDDPDVALIASAARRALDESRRAIATLTRPLDEPFSSALAETLDELARRTGCQIDAELDEVHTVSPAQREALLRIAREAVGNALRHARCESVRVTLTDGSPLTLTVADDGCGFDPCVPGNPYGFGLISMRERAAALGAGFDLRSAPGHGTTIVLTLTDASPREGSR